MTTHSKTMIFGLALALMVPAVGVITPGEAQAAPGDVLSGAHSGGEREHKQAGARTVSTRGSKKSSSRSKKSSSRSKKSSSRSKKSSRTTHHRTTTRHSGTRHTTNRRPHTSRTTTTRTTTRHGGGKVVHRSSTRRPASTSRTTVHHRHSNPRRTKVVHHRDRRTTVHHRTTTERRVVHHSRPSRTVVHHRTTRPSRTVVHHHHSPRPSRTVVHHHHTTSSTPNAGGSVAASAPARRQRSRDLYVTGGMGLSGMAATQVADQALPGLDFNVGVGGKKGLVATEVNFGMAGYRLDGADAINTADLTVFSVAGDLKLQPSLAFFEPYVSAGLGGHVYTDHIIDESAAGASLRLGAGADLRFDNVAVGVQYQRQYMGLVGDSRVYNNGAMGATTESIGAGLKIYF